MSKKIKYLKTVLILLTFSLALFFGIRGFASLRISEKGFSLTGTETFFRLSEDEGYEDETVCPVVFRNADGSLTCTENYTFEEWENLSGDATVTAYIYENADGKTVALPRQAEKGDIKAVLKNEIADEENRTFGIFMALLLISAALIIITAFDRVFTAYEQIWFLSIMVIAAVVSLIAPEESCNGVNGIVIMALYLADTLLNILCELLISKQSKWNFIVSVFVEITEIAICMVLSYRFATLASTLFFWLPCDIISFINWHKHPDRQEDEITEVRALKGWQEAAVLAGVALWTVGVGYFLTTLDFGTDFFGGNRTTEVIICYLDACASAVGVVNGVFILLRLREQWIAWYLSALLEAAMNIITGQYVLLVLKAGYITNTTYGFIKWTKYIKAAGIPAAENKVSE